MKCVRVPSSRLHHVAADEACAVVGDRLDGAFELAPRGGEARDDRRHQHARVDVRRRQLADRAQPLQRMAPFRLERAPRVLVDGAERSCGQCTRRAAV